MFIIAPVAVHRGIPAMLLMTLAIVYLAGCPKQTEQGGTAPKGESTPSSAPKATKPPSKAAKAAKPAGSLIEALQAGDVEAVLKAAKDRKLPLPTSAEQLLPSGKEWVFVYIKYEQIKALLLEHLMPPPCDTANETLGKLLSGVKKRGKALLKRGKQDKSGVLPSVLHLAALTCSDKIMGGLVKVGLDVSARDRFGLTPLHYVSCGRAAKKLVDLGGDVNARSGRGLRPLHLAVNTNVAKVLLDKGAKIDAQDDCGNAPLHLVMDQGEPGGGPASNLTDATVAGALAKAHPVVRWLSKQAVRLGRKIAYEMDELTRLLDVAGFLKSRGAKTDLKNKLGQTPAEARSKRGSSYDD